ncbi:MAG: endonuclease domain-containing protein [Candidatus Magasanikbacteria bacterium]
MLTRKDVKETRRNLRHNQTEAEDVFWRYVRNRKLNGVKFQRQYSFVFNDISKIKFFVADFYCHEFKLIVEIDGDVHLGEKQKEKDQFRTDRLNELGIKVIRFTNEEVTANIENVLNTIKAHLK